MVNSEWGIKRACQACGIIFYDLNKDPIVCPKCDVGFDPEAILKSRRNRMPVVEEAEAKVKGDKEKIAADDEIVEAGLDDEDVLPEVDDETGIDADNSLISEEAGEGTNEELIDTQ